MRLMGLMLAGPRSRDGAGGADRPRRVERGASASWTTGRWTWRGAGDGEPAELHRRSRLRDLGGAVLSAHALPRGAGGGRGARARRLRHAGAALDAAGEELADLVRRAPADLRRLRGRRWSASCGWARATSSAGTAAAREAEAGPRLRRVSLAIEAEDADVMGDEPIWARVDARLRRGRAVARLRRARASTPTAPAIAEGRRAARRRLAGGRLGDLGRLRAFGARCRWRRATCRRRSPSATRRGSSRSRSSGCAGRRASSSSRRSIPTGARMRA